MSPKNQRKSRKQDPDASAGRSRYLTALQCYQPEFFYELYDARGKPDRFHEIRIKDDWLARVALATLSYWSDHPTDAERMLRCRRLRINLIDIEDEILSSARKKGEAISERELIERVTVHLVGKSGSDVVNDLLTQWFVFDRPEGDWREYLRPGERAKRCLEFKFDPPGIQTREKWVRNLPSETDWRLVPERAKAPETVRIGSELYLLNSSTGGWDHVPQNSALWEDACRAERMRADEQRRQAEQLENRRSQLWTEAEESEKRSRTSGPPNGRYINVTEYEPIDEYKVRAVRAFKQELERYCRYFSPEYAQWDQDLTRQAKWTVLFQSGKRSQKRLADDWSYLIGEETSEGNIQKQIKRFCRHIGLSAPTRNG